MSQQDTVRLLLTREGLIILPHKVLVIYELFLP